MLQMRVNLKCVIIRRLYLITRFLKDVLVICNK